MTGKEMNISSISKTSPGQAAFTDVTTLSPEENARG